MSAQLFWYNPGSETRSMEAAPMKAIELIGNIEDYASIAWANGIAREWTDELRDTRQDIYTLDDGQPANAPGDPQLL